MNLTADNTAIVVDSTADFPDAAERFPNWRVVPLYVNFGTESFRDGVDLDATQFYERLKSSPTLPTTSQPTPADFLACYAGARPRTSGSCPSTSRRSSRARSRARASRPPSSVTDACGRSTRRPRPPRSRCSASPIQRRLERGTTDEEVDALVERYRETHGLLFTVDTLEFLARGGRIGRAKAFAGQLMNVKPILAIVDGEVIPVKRVRGNRKAFQEFVDALDTRTSDVPTLHIGIAHADAPERMAELEKMVRDRRPQAQIEAETSLGAVVGTHSGPGCVGFFWFDDVDG